MDYKEYTERVAPIYARYKNAKAHRCELTARARVRDMARLYAQYRGVRYEDAYKLCRDKLCADGMIPT